MENGTKHDFSSGSFAESADLFRKKRVWHGCKGMILLVTSASTVCASGLYGRLAFIRDEKQYSVMFFGGSKSLMGFRKLVKCTAFVLLAGIGAGI